MPCRLPGPAPCVLYGGKLGSLTVYVVWNGKDSTFGVDNVGTVPAALSTYLAVHVLKPDLVISTGTCGGFRSQVR